MTEGFAYTRGRVLLETLAPNTGQVDGLPANPRRWTKAEVKRLAASMRETPELLELRPVIALRHGDGLVVLGGNLRLEAARLLGLGSVPVLIVEDTVPPEKLEEIVIKDNGAFGEWDTEMLLKDWGGLDLKGWGVPDWGTEPAGTEAQDGDRDEYERKRREFDERMKAGEDLEQDEEYQAFLAKFEPKKTTDDCYTPKPVYDALCAWLECEYGLDRSTFVRPFYPGGDYKSYDYPPGCTVVDNPPFSILAEILRFYDGRGIPYFLFGPHLTLFSSTTGCRVVTGVQVTYDNGAVVNTSFISGLPQDRDIAAKSSPSLYKAIREADDANRAAMRKNMPKYQYPLNVVTAPMLAPYARLGIPFVIPRAECVRISRLDAQGKDAGIFGSGLLVSERLAAEREKAEREKAVVWELSEREKAIVEGLKV